MGCYYVRILMLLIFSLVNWVFNSDVFCFILWLFGDFYFMWIIKFYVFYLEKEFFFLDVCRVSMSFKRDF